MSKLKDNVNIDNNVENNIDNEVQTLRKGDAIAIKEGIAIIQEIKKENDNISNIRVQLVNENKILNININDITKIVSSFEILKKNLQMLRNLQMKKLK